MFVFPIEGFSVLGRAMNGIGGVERGVHTRGGVSNAACSSRMRLAEPLTRKVPSTSVAASDE